MTGLTSCGYNHIYFGEIFIRYSPRVCNHGNLSYFAYLNLLLVVQRINTLKSSGNPSIKFVGIADEHVGYWQ